MTPPPRVRLLVGRLGRALVAWAAGKENVRSGEARDADDRPAGTPAPARTESVYADALKQWSTAVTWLIGALAAVAAAMIAGSQLSSIGKLEAGSQRLAVAVTGLVVSVVLILAAIGLLFWAQSPINTDFSRVIALADGTAHGRLVDALRRMVCEDNTLNRGKGDLAGLLAALNTIREDYNSLRQHESEAGREAARESNDARRADAQARRKRYTAELAVVSDDMSEYRKALLRVAQLDKFLRTRRRFRIASILVLIMTVPATVGFVGFAWAANPAPTASDAIDQRPVTAVLKLSEQGTKSLQDRLGRDCARAAYSSGVGVVALSSSPDGIEVVLTPSANCPEPVRLTVNAAIGTVEAASSALDAK